MSELWPIPVALGITGAIFFLERWDWKWMMFKPNPRRYIPTKEEIENRNKDFS
jgi:hypothetical protein